MPHLLPHLTGLEWLIYAISFVPFLVTAWIRIGDWDRQNDDRERRRGRTRR